MYKCVLGGRFGQLLRNPDLDKRIDEWMCDEWKCSYIFDFTVGELSWDVLSVGLNACVELAGLI